MLAPTHFSRGHKLYNAVQSALKKVANAHSDTVRWGLALICLTSLSGHILAVSLDSRLDIQQNLD